MICSPLSPVIHLAMTFISLVNSNRIVFNLVQCRLKSNTEVVGYHHDILASYCTNGHILLGCSLVVAHTVQSWVRLDKFSVIEQRVASSSTVKYRS